MSRKRPLFTANGLKLILEDLEAISDVAGRADDLAVSKERLAFVEDSTRKGYVLPWRDGPIVVTDGATGKVKVRPFWAFRSAGGATSNPSTQDASGGTETIEDMISAFFSGESISAPTPVPSAGQVRWDLLYAVVQMVDSDAATRLVKNPATKVTSAQSVYTRKKPVVTLAWKQGTAVATGSASYGSGNMPSIPSAGSGTAVVPLAYVQMRNSGSPSTVTYDKDTIANCPRMLRPNPRSGGVAVAGAMASGREGVVGFMKADAATIISTTIAEGGWPLTGSNIRPQRFIEYLGGAIELMIPIGPFSTAAGTETFFSAFSSSPLIYLAPNAALGINDPLREDKPWDWRNRIFWSQLQWGTGSQKFAWDPAATTTTGMPQSIGAAAGTGASISWGNSILGNASLDAGIGNSNYYLAARHELATNVELAIVVKKSDGSMYLIGRDDGSDVLNGRVGIMFFRAWDSFGPGSVG